MSEQATQYKVTSKWCGWLGGWGSEGDIAQHIEQNSTGGWQLLRTENSIHFWFWFFPRHKMLFIFTR